MTNSIYPSPELRAEYDKRSYGIMKEENFIKMISIAEELLGTKFNSGNIQSFERDIRKIPGFGVKFFRATRQYFWEKERINYE